MQVRGTRHALRVLQSADVSQWDWHEGQIMCHQTGKDRPKLGCVFLDFGLSFQSDPGFDADPGHARGDVFDVLCEDVKLDEELVKANFDPVEVWDYNLDV